MAEVKLRKALEDIGRKTYTADEKEERAYRLERTLIRSLRDLQGTLGVDDKIILFNVRTEHARNYADSFYKDFQHKIILTPGGIKEWGSFLAKDDTGGYKKEEYVDDHGTRVSDYVRSLTMSDEKQSSVKKNNQIYLAQRIIEIYSGVEEPKEIITEIIH